MQEPRPCLYRVEQDFVGPDGVRRTRTGVIALVRLEPYDARVVRPHERTYSGPKAGRLRLLRATRAQLSPVFALYDDPSGRVEAALAAGRGARRRDRRHGRPGHAAPPVARAERPRGGRGRARRLPAADRGRPPPLRDGPRLPGRARRQRRRAGGLDDDVPRQRLLAGAADLPHPPRGARASRPTCARRCRSGSAALGFAVEPRPGDDAAALARALDGAGASAGRRDLAARRRAAAGAAGRRRRPQRRAAVAARAST